MLDLPFRSAKQLAAASRRKKIGCLELLETSLARVERYNPALNAVIATDRDGARKRARAADRALARKAIWGPLHGVPMTIKESYDVVGLPTTWPSDGRCRQVGRQDGRGRSRRGALPPGVGAGRRDAHRVALLTMQRGEGFP